eukprot:Gb_01495 [translate_table: standard]
MAILIPDTFLGPAFIRRRLSAGLNGPSILCDPCKGKGWVNCDFCNGQKINVQAQINRFYWRCPSCRADILTAWRIDNFCREDGFLLGQKKVNVSLIQTFDFITSGWMIGSILPDESTLEYKICYAFGSDLEGVKTTLEKISGMVSKIGKRKMKELNSFGGEYGVTQKVDSVKLKQKKQEIGSPSYKHQEEELALNINRSEKKPESTLQAFEQGFAINKGTLKQRKLLEVTLPDTNDMMNKILNKEVEKMVFQNA